MTRGRWIWAWMIVVAFLAPARRAEAQAPPKRVALLVGINEYSRRGFKSLKWAENDVKELASEFEKLRFDKVVVMAGSDPGAGSPTREAILGRLDALLGGVTKRDVVVVVLCGHGQQLPVKRDDGVQVEDSFFCPVDAIVDHPETMVSLSDLTDRVLHEKGGKNLVLIDACRDGKRDADRGVRGIQGRVVKLEEDTAILFSCRAGQQSEERGELRHGVFTHSVLSALRERREGPLDWDLLVSSTKAHMARLIDASQQEPIAASTLGRVVLDGGRPSIAQPKLLCRIPTLDAGGHFHFQRFTDDGRLLGTAEGSPKGELFAIYETGTGRLVQRVDAHPEFKDSCSAPGGAGLLCGDGSRFLVSKSRPGSTALNVLQDVELRDTATNRVIKNITGIVDSTFSVIGLSADGSTVIVGEESRDAKAKDADGESVAWTMASHDMDRGTVERRRVVGPRKPFGSREKVLWWTDARNRLRVMDLELGQNLLDRTSPPPLKKGDWSQSGWAGFARSDRALVLLYVGAKPETKIKLGEFDDLELSRCLIRKIGPDDVEEIPVPFLAASTPELSEDGRRLISTQYDPDTESWDVVVWDVERRQMLLQVSQGAGRLFVSDMGLSADGRFAFIPRFRSRDQLGSKTIRDVAEVWRLPD